MVPGLGQLFNRRPRLAALFLVPSLILIAIALLLIQTQSPARLAAWVVSPRSSARCWRSTRSSSPGACWRSVRRSSTPAGPGPTGRLGIIGIVVIAILVALPHVAVWRYGTIMGDTFARIFQAARARTARAAATGPVPKDGERINVLLVGVDKLPDRTAR